MQRISLDLFETVEPVTDTEDCNKPEDVTAASEQVTEDRLDATTCHSGLYLDAIIYDHKWYIGLITDWSDEEEDIISSPSSDLLCVMS